MRIFRYILLTVTTVFAASCSSDGVLEDVNVVNDHLPMVFGTSSSAPESVVTKGSTPLEADFRVSTWKNFDKQEQLTVMSGFKVDYTASAAPYKWNYVGVNDQPQRYWDLSAFPYEFRAVSPYMDAASLDATGISIDVQLQPFRAQTLVDDVYNVESKEAEPCLVSHVNRVKEGDDYVDRDCIKKVEINADAKANAVREVHLPFHHLISKVGFRIFIDDPQPSSPDYQVTLKDVQISIVNDGNNFITSSQTYTATNAQGLGKGTFSNNATATGEFVLLSHGEYTGVNLRENLNRETAFDLSPLYLQQIPQKNLRIRVQITMQTDHVVNGTVDESHTFAYNSLLTMDKENAAGEYFAWEPEKRYVYYLHIPNLLGHDIFLDTCEILPWDEVQTSEIPVEL